MSVVATFKNKTSYYISSLINGGKEFNWQKSHPTSLGKCNTGHGERRFAIKEKTNKLRLFYNFLLLSQISILRAS